MRRLGFGMMMGTKRLGAAISESQILECSDVEKMRFHRLKAVFISTRGNAPGLKFRETNRPRANAGCALYAGIGRKGADNVNWYFSYDMLPLQGAVLHRYPHTRGAAPG